MPLFRFESLRFDVEILEAAYLLFELDDESNLRADAEVADAQEADSLQERKPVQLLLISSQ